MIAFLVTIVTVSAVVADTNECKTGICRMSVFGSCGAVVCDGRQMVYFGGSWLFCAAGVALLAALRRHQAVAEALVGWDDVVTGEAKIAHKEKVAWEATSYMIDYEFSGERSDGKCFHATVSSCEIPRSVWVHVSPGQTVSVKYMHDDPGLVMLEDVLESKDSEWLRYKWLVVGFAILFFISGLVCATQALCRGCWSPIINGIACVMFALALVPVWCIGCCCCRVSRAKVEFLDDTSSDDT
eukprot:TRINITY_DN8969_c0_g1_i1.p1 TRINITY_DN8969_c0_g1~~TRINITY_DN8969_c0_g1_i1.p1  ORF type:complete len:259 (-),score=40.52 TRINITY_DN8969_c0_g1_i1:50-772(-)